MLTGLRRLMHGATERIRPVSEVLRFPQAPPRDPVRLGRRPFHPATVWLGRGLGRWRSARASQGMGIRVDQSSPAHAKRSRARYLQEAETDIPSDIP